MYLVEEFYRKVLKKEAPYYTKYSFLTIIWKPIRKYINVVIIPNTPFSSLRIYLYRVIGFKVGKNVFIGMKCYLDDLAIDKIVIEDNAIISYGCYFACHGKGQGHTQIIIKEGAYIGMRCNLISGHRGITIGENSIVGAGSLVNRDIPFNAKAVGVPIKILDDKENIESN
ncbi:MAG: acyltransferase [Epsilonproteobacteria bacterium]|nr:acyltransferase [Campylobacterota bacterium]